MLAIAISTILAAAVFGRGRQAEKEKDANNPAYAAQRRAIYEQALNSKDPVKLRAMAKIFREQGHIPEANMLDKRVALAESPREAILERRRIFKKAMECEDPEKVLNIAFAFETIGATGASDDLYRRVEQLNHQKRVAAEGVATEEAAQ